MRKCNLCKVFFISTGTIHVGLLVRIRMVTRGGRVWEETEWGSGGRCCRKERIALNQELVRESQLVGTDWGYSKSLIKIPMSEIFVFLR